MLDRISMKFTTMYQLSSYQGRIIENHNKGGRFSVTIGIRNWVLFTYQAAWNKVSWKKNVTTTVE